MIRALLAALAVVAGCVRPGAVSCGDGTECPIGYKCTRGDLCVLPEQIDACLGLSDGDHCTAGPLVGICDGGLCLPGCGDGVLGAEECDDGNLLSHDGCSSACLTEEMSWQAWESGWSARVCGGLAYHDTIDKYVLFGGINHRDTLGDHWERDGEGSWERRDLSPMPSPRSSHAMAYYPGRGVVVLLGGYHPDDGLKGDTWEYDGSAWRLVTTAPLERANAAVAYVPNLGVVIYGGNRGPAASATYNETFRYDGSTWTNITDQSVPAGELPSRRHSAAMVYDPVRQRLVLFGGFRRQIGPTNETWELDPTAMPPTWTEQKPSTLPPARSQHSMVWLPDRERIVMIGGRLGSGQEAGDVWEYEYDAVSGKMNWVQRLPGATPPPVRACAAVAASDDPQMFSAVMVGGTNQSGDLDDVWTLDVGTTDPQWTDGSPRFEPRGGLPIAYDTARRGVIATSGDEVWRFDDSGTGWRFVVPAPDVPVSIARRIAHATAYDAPRDRTVIFGGTSLIASGTQTPGELDELNEWDEMTGWHLPPDPANPVGPTARAMSAAVYHAKDGITLLFGGGNGPRSAETWEWDGTAWSQIASQSGPAGEPAPAMAYDPVCERAIMFGRAAVTWAYADHQWTQLDTISSPDGRRGAAMAYDPRRQHITLFGGQVGGAVAMDLWELVGGDSDAPCEARAPACPATKVAWCPVPIVGTAPLARLRTGMTYRANDPAAGLLVFGGFGPNGTLDDTWFLRYASPTPDEICDNEIDDDGDRKLDASDPDCGPW